ncbi:insulinase family protein, partial [Mesorhizobium sp. M2C.T.Ca.TU.009.01.2.1]
MTPTGIGLRAALLVGTLALAAAPARAADDGEVKDFLLDNGMEVVVIPD